MPGYVIHLAIAEEYLRKNKDNKEKYNKFIEGVIFPDSVEDKSKTHYGKSSSKTNLYKFLKENDISKSFKRGYFLHLLTDYIFYNKYLDKFSKDIYNDYDVLNYELMSKYNVIIPEDIKCKVFFKEKEELKILSKELVEKLIIEISSENLDRVAKQIKENKEEWTKFKTLKCI